jgi:hypothetical protein
MTGRRELRDGPVQTARGAHPRLDCKCPSYRHQLLCCRRSAVSHPAASGRLVAGRAAGSSGGRGTAGSGVTVGGAVAGGAERLGVPRDRIRAWANHVASAAIVRRGIARRIQNRGRRWVFGAELSRASVASERLVPASLSACRWLGFGLGSSLLAIGESSGAARLAAASASAKERGRGRCSGGGASCGRGAGDGVGW